MFDHPQVVRDEQVGKLKPLLQILEQIDDLRLDRNVEGRDRFVEDQEARIHRERARDSDPLALPSRELMRIAPHRFGVEADQAQQLGDSLLLFFAAGELVDLQTFAHDRRHLHARIERRVRVLENHLHQPA